MPPVKKDEQHVRSIKDFLKPFTIPKNRIPANDIIEDEIVVASTKTSSPLSIRHSQKPSLSPKASKDGQTGTATQKLESSSALSSLSSSPTKPTSRKSTPKQRTAGSRQHSKEESPLISTSPLTSQRRVMTAVEIPSPRLEQPTTKTEKPDPTTISFSSLSTLSSVPVSTQSSSRRIIKNGIQAITNSDSGSADSSEDELADVSTFIPRKKLKITPSPLSEQDEEQTSETSKTVKRSMRQSMQASTGGKRSSGATTPRREDSVPTQKGYKYSLENIMKHQNQENEADRRRQEKNEEFALVERTREEGRQRDRREMLGLTAVAADDSDDAERVMLAMQRTGALEEDEEFFYFRGIQQGVRNQAFPSSPEEVREPWVWKLRDERWRTHACLSGFVADIAAKHGLPRGVRRWFAEQLLHEQRDDLCKAYLWILESCRKDMPGASLDKMHSNEGGDLNFCNLSDYYQLRDLTVEDNVKTGTPTRTSKLSAPRLDYTIRAVRHFSSPYNRGASTLLEFIFSKIDASVGKDTALKRSIDNSIEYLLNGIDDIPDRRREFFSEVANGLAAAKISEQLKCRAIASVPAFSHRSHALRRHLALQLVAAPERSAVWSPSQYGEAILSRLKKESRFHISDSTDYATLNSLIQVLDIAIDNGFTGDLPDAPATKETQPSVRKDTEPPLTTSDTEKAFNAQIDAFVSQLQLMASRIKDVGTSHLRRTQAKSAIERLAKRLEYGVRTKRKARKGVFSDSWGVGAGQRGFLNGFLKSGDKSIRMVDGSEVVSGKEMKSRAEDVAVGVAKGLQVGVDIASVS